MTDIRLAIGAVLAGLALTGSLAAQDTPHHTVGREVKLTSCVERAVRPNTFVLTHTADVPTHPPVHGRVVYWLDTVEPLQPHVGHEIQVAGTVSAVTHERMRMRQGEEGWVVEIDGPGREMMATAAQVGVATGALDADDDDIAITLVRVTVSAITMTAETCPVVPGVASR